MSNYTVRIKADRAGLIEYLREQVAAAEDARKAAGTKEAKAEAKGRAAGLESAISTIERWEPEGEEAQALAGPALVREFAGFGGGHD